MSVGAPWSLFGEALTDWVHGRRDAPLEVVLGDGRRLEYPLRLFFRREFSDVEATALELCRGRVLDVGCGTGGHSLELQERGLSVTGLEVEPRVADLARARGVGEVVTGTVEELPAGERYETILMLMNGIGIAGDRDGLGRLLDRCRERLAPGGHLIVDSSDLEHSADAKDRQGWRDREAAGDDPRTVRMRWEYRGREGEPFVWYYADPRTLAEAAAEAGWRSQVVFEDGDGAFLARLTPNGGVEGDGGTSLSGTFRGAAAST